MMAARSAITKMNSDSDQNKLNKMITEDLVLKIVKKTIHDGDEDVCVKDVRYVPAADYKLGFLGDYFKMTVWVRSGNKGFELKYFVKCLPLHNEEHARYIREFKFMNREVLAYELMEKFRDDGDMACLAKYYLGTDSTLVLEDLNASGFKSADPRVLFTKEQCKVALGTLANMHARSLIYEEKQSKIRNKKYRLDEEYKDVFDESGYRIEDGWYRAGMASMLGAAKEFTNDGHLIAEEKWEELWAYALTLGDPSTEERNVLCHRDLWASNLLFKYDPNGKVEKCVFVDLQGTRCMPPAADVVSLIYLNVSRKNKDIWMTDLIKHYYDELTSRLTNEGYDIEDFVPKDRFFRSCADYRLFGLILVGSLLPLVTIKRTYMESIFSDDKSYKNIILVDRTAFVCKAMSEEDDYRQRIVDYLEEMIEMLILK